MLDSGQSIEATSIYHNMLVHKKNAVEELHLTVIEYSIIDLISCVCPHYNPFAVKKE